MLEEERNPTVKGGEKKIIQHAPLPYDQDPRLQTLMEDSVSLLKNIQMKKFLTPLPFQELTKRNFNAFKHFVSHKSEV